MQTCINILGAKRHKHSLFHQTYAMVVRNEKHDFPWLQKGHSSLMTTKDMDTTSIFPKAKACIGLPVKFCHVFVDSQLVMVQQNNQNMKKKSVNKTVSHKNLWRSLKHLYWHTRNLMILLMVQKSGKPPGMYKTGFFPPTAVDEFLFASINSQKLTLPNASIFRSRQQCQTFHRRGSSGSKRLGRCRWFFVNFLNGKCLGVRGDTPQTSP